MRNARGVEIKPGFWVEGFGPRGGHVMGTVQSVWSAKGANKSGVYVTLTDGRKLDADSITQTLGRMNVADDGTVKQNPLTRVRIKSPPQRPAGNTSAPSKRLVKRRKKTAKAAPGVYANPLDTRVKFGDALKDYPAPDAMRDFGEHYFVQWKREGDRMWSHQALFNTRAEAERYAKDWHRRAPEIYIRVVSPSPATGYQKTAHLRRR